MTHRFRVVTNHPGPFKSPPVQEHEHFFPVCRYAECDASKADAHKSFLDRSEATAGSPPTPQKAARPRK